MLMVYVAGCRIPSDLPISIVSLLPAPSIFLPLASFIRMVKETAWLVMPRGQISNSYQYIMLTSLFPSKYRLIADRSQTSHPLSRVFL